MLDNLAVRAMLMKDRLVRRFKSEKGDMVQWILIIAVALGLAFIFREQIQGLIEKVFTNTNTAIDDLGKK